jgi:hypothetical protein
MAAKKCIETNIKQAVATFLDERHQLSLDASYCRVIPKLIGLHEKMSEFLESVESNDDELQCRKTTSPKPPCDQNPSHARPTSDESSPKLNPARTAQQPSGSLQRQPLLSGVEVPYQPSIHSAAYARTLPTPKKKLIRKPTLQAKIAAERTEGILLLEGQMSAASTPAVLPPESGSHEPGGCARAEQASVQRQHALEHRAGGKRRRVAGASVE